MVMKTTHTFGVQFIVRKNKAKNGLLPVYARITVSSRRAEISLKQAISQDEWNPVKEKARGTRPEVRQFNKYLSDVRTRLHECYQELLLQKKTITVEAVKNMFLGEDIKEHTLNRACL
jgi:integrase/recombinase XerD